MDFIAPVAALPDLTATTSLSMPAASLDTTMQAAGGANFSQWIERGLADVNGQLAVNQTDLQQLATGDVRNLHQVMIRLEESRLSFQLMMQVRGRLLEAYQDIMKMPV